MNAEVGRRRLIVAGAIFLVVAGVVAFTTRDPGLTWDEAIYYRYAVGYVEWFQKQPFLEEPFGEASLAGTWGGPVDQPPHGIAWRGGQVHPPLGKIWIALCLAIFGQGTDLVTAARLGAGLLFAAVAAALYFWLAGRKNERVGLMAAVAFVLMPRIFAHGHFANLGMPMLLLWLLTVIAFEHGMRSRRWAIACGVLFGLALLTKVDAVFLPVVLVPWGLLYHRRKALPALIAMAVIGPMMFLGGWPGLWHHPLAGTWLYLADKARRMLLPVYYLGTAYKESPAPWHYPFVMLAVTTPLPILAAVVAASGVILRRLRAQWKKRGFETLLLLNAAFPVLLFAVPGVPKYDGVRLLMTAFPFIAALAALGAEAAWERVRTRLKEPRRAAWCLGTILALWLLLPVVVFHPFQLCYYNELVGGPWGAHRLGFETTYWNDTLTQEALDVVNQRARPKERVARLAVGDLVWLIHGVMGGLRGDLRDGDFKDGRWDILVVVPRQGWLTDEQRAFLSAHKPLWSKRLPPFGNLPVCLIYARSEQPVP